MRLVSIYQNKMNSQNQLFVFFSSFGSDLFQMTVTEVSQKAREYLDGINETYDDNEILVALAEAKRALPEPKDVTETKKQLRIYLQALELDKSKVKNETIINWATNFLKSKNLWSFSWANWYYNEMFSCIVSVRNEVQNLDNWAEKRKDNTTHDEILERSDVLIEVNELEDEKDKTSHNGFVLLTDEVECHHDVIYEANVGFVIGMVDRHFANREGHLGNLQQSARCS